MGVCGGREEGGQGGAQGGIEDKNRTLVGPGRMCRVEELDKLCLRGRPRILLGAEKEKGGVMGSRWLIHDSLIPQPPGQPSSLLTPVPNRDSKAEKDGHPPVVTE